MKAEKGNEAVNVRGEDGGNVQGSPRAPRANDSQRPPPLWALPLVI